MARARLFRFRDRASFKPSEVVGLFLISLFGWMLFFVLVMTLDRLLSPWLG
jgi:hypothetical protein